MYSVIDCNNFYVSCERVFQPKYNHHPVVVLSNNDWCVISRSKEAKQIGVPMGAPAFKYENLFKQHDVKIFSANFALYADMSARVMHTIAEYGQEMEIYSIDEAFLRLYGFSHEQLIDVSQEMHASILKKVGIPVSIGIAQTKTLSKVANEIAKQNNKHNGVYLINTNQFTTIPVSDVWGIGRRLTIFLNERGIFTIQQLIECDNQWIKDNLTMSGLKTVRELRGESCIDLEEVRPAKQTIISSKSFGRPVEAKIHLKEAVATFTARAAEKLREEQEVAERIGVSLVVQSSKQYYKTPTQWNDTIKLLQPTDYTPDLISAALEIVDKIFKKEYKYKKATVYLFNLREKDAVQNGLWHRTSASWKDSTREHDELLMNAVDMINAELGSETVRFGAQGIQTTWKQRRMKRSPRYTTRWDELLIAGCKRDKF